MRQVVLDTETTGLEYQSGHRIIEIGCVELVDRKLTGRHYHQYIQPQRDIDAGAQEVHGITAEFLADKPLFADIVNDFVEFVSGAELIIHNAPFDVGFINHELGLLGGELRQIETVCGVLDSLELARKMHPGARNNLDALCQRYDIDNSQRDLHGALLDSEILADVFISMTTGQTNLGLGGDQDGDAYGGESAEKMRRLVLGDIQPKVLLADEEALELHKEWEAKSADILGKNVWQ